MPRVPTYRFSQVSERPMADFSLRVQVTPDLFGASVGRAIGEAGRAVAGSVRQVSHVVADIQEKADHARALDAGTQLQSFTDEMVAEAQQSQRGKNALGLEDRLSGKFEERAGEIAGELSTMRQRQDFQRITDRVRLSMTRKVRAHTNVEAEKYYDSLMAESIRARAESSLAGMYDPAEVRESVEDQVSIWRSYAKKRGLPEKMIENRAREIASVQHAKTVEKLISEDRHNEALQHFKDNKSDLRPQDRTALKKMLDASSLRERAQVVTDTMLHSETDFMGNPVKQPTLGEALEQVREIDDPALRDEVQRRVVEFFRLQRSAERFEQESNFERFFDELGRNGGDLQAVIDANQSQYDALDSGQVRALEARTRELRGSLAPEDRKETLENTLAAYRLSRMVDQGFVQTEEGDQIPWTPARILGWASANGLTVTQGKDVLERWHNAQNGTLQLSLTQFERVMTSVTGLSGKKLDEKIAEHPELWDLTRESLPLGQPVEDDQVKRVVSRLLAEGEAIGQGFLGGDPDQTLLEAQAAGKVNVWLPNLTEFEKAQMRLTLESLPTDIGQINDVETVLRQMKKYAPVNAGGLGLPTPINPDTGLPMDFEEAILVGPQGEELVDPTGGQVTEEIERRRGLGLSTPAPRSPERDQLPDPESAGPLAPSDDQIDLVLRVMALSGSSEEEVQQMSRVLRGGE